MIPPAEIARLWREHARGLELLARSRGASVSGSCSAEDFVQEAFIRLARQAEMPDDPLAWLARTIRNIVIDASRSEGRRRRREQLFVERGEPWFELSDDQQPGGLSAEEVSSLLGQLEPGDREIIVAHVWGGMTFRQISLVYDISSSSAHRRYLSALQQLRQSLGIQSASQ